VITGQLLFTPNTSAKSSLGTPVQDELQVQVTDVYDQYQEASGMNNRSCTATVERETTKERKVANMQSATKQQRGAPVEHIVPTEK
jgi:hypothetical protein